MYTTRTITIKTKEGKMMLPNDNINLYASTEKLLPPYNEIPDEFRRGKTKWNKLFSDWFFNGLTKLDITPKEGIDKNKAMFHLRVAMQGWDTAHEHKEAGVAYLMSLWFDNAIWERKKN